MDFEEETKASVTLGLIFTTFSPISKQILTLFSVAYETLVLVALHVLAKP